MAGMPKGVATLELYCAPAEYEPAAGVFPLAVTLALAAEEDCVVTPGAGGTPNEGAGVGVADGRQDAHRHWTGMGWPTRISEAARDFCAAST